MEKTREGGYYKLTGDFEEVPYSGKYVRDINFTPANRNLPDIGICRIYSSREDAEKMLGALQPNLCLRCSHEWRSKTTEKPTICPKCKSPYWNKPKKQSI